MTTKQPSPIIVIASGTKWSAATPNLKIVFVLWGCFVVPPRNDSAATPNLKIVFVLWGCFVVPPRKDSAATPNLKTRVRTLGLLRHSSSQ